MACIGVLRRTAEHGREAVVRRTDIFRGFRCVRHHATRPATGCEALRSLRPPMLPSASQRARRVPGSTSVPHVARGDAQGVCPSETASAAALRCRTTPRGMARPRIAWSNRFWSDDVFTSELVNTSFCSSPPRPATGAIPPAVRPVKEHMRGRGQVEKCRCHRVQRIAASCEAWQFFGGTGFGVFPFVVRRAWCHATLGDARLR